MGGRGSFSLGLNAAVTLALFPMRRISLSCRGFLGRTGMQEAPLRILAGQLAFLLDNEGELSDPEKPLRRAAAPLSRGVKRLRLFWPGRLPERSPLTDTV